MNKKFFALLILIVIASSGCAFGASHKGVKVSSEGREIPSDQNLPAYNNPKEIDFVKDKLHISFKGAFRAADSFGKFTDWVYFAFTARAKKDIYLAVGQSELFDSRAKSYKYHSVPNIGNERVFGRNIVAELDVPILVGVYMPVSEAGEFPSIAQITITFNKRAFKFCNIVAEDWVTWEELRRELNL